MPSELTAGDMSRETSKASSQWSVTSQDNVIYDSNEIVPQSFWMWSVLWCGCCDPSYYITDATVQVNVCSGCGRTVDSMLFDNIWDVRRDKNCCCSCWNCCPCLDDVGDILLYGQDGVEKGINDDGAYRLKRIFRSKEVFDELAELVQTKHAGFRLNQRNVGKGVQLQKAKIKASPSEV